MRLLPEFLKAKSQALAVMAVCFAEVLHGQTNVFPTSGNVGIGTTTPGSSLTVNGGTSLGGSVSNGVLGVGVGPQPNFLLYAEGSETMAQGVAEVEGIAVNLDVTPQGSWTGFNVANAVKGVSYWNGAMINPSVNLGGGYFESAYGGTTGGTLGTLYGAQSLAVNVGTGTVTSAYGGLFAVDNEGGGTIDYEVGWAKKK